MKIFCIILMGVLVLREWQHRRDTRKIHDAHSRRSTDMASDHLQQVERLKAQRGRAGTQHL